MEGESKTREIKNKTKKAEPNEGSVTDVSDVLPPVWVRRALQIYNGYKRLILDGRYSFLFYFRLFLAVLYFAYSNFK